MCEKQVWRCVCGIHKVTHCVLPLVGSHVGCSLLQLCHNAVVHGDARVCGGSRQGERHELPKVWPLGELVPRFAHQGPGAHKLQRVYPLHEQQTNVIPATPHEMCTSVCVSQAASIANTAMHLTMATVKPSALSMLLLCWCVVPARLPFVPHLVVLQMVESPCHRHVQALQMRLACCCQKRCHLRHHQHH